MTPIGSQIATYVYTPPKVQVGDMMADGLLFDLDEKPHRLSEFKGKYILLDFWAPGCTPCIKAIPELEEMAELYKDKLEVVSICIGYPSTWKRLVEQHKMKGNQLCEMRQTYSGFYAAYQIDGFPTFFIISPEGKIIKRWSGYDVFGEKGMIKAKLKEAFQEQE